MSLIPWSVLAFMPHGHCYLWDPILIWLHVLSDSLIALSYFTITTALFVFLRRRRETPYPYLFALFAAFIVACGITHALEVASVWSPIYWGAGTMKMVTALISAVTAVVALRALPDAARLRSPSELDFANLQLEQRVAQRTSELAEANRKLLDEVNQRKTMETEVRRLNESLQLKVDELNTLFDILPVGVAIANSADCSEIRINQKFSALLGIHKSRNASLSAPEEARPTTFRVFAQGKELAPHELPMQIAARENRPIYDFEEEVIRSDGVNLDIVTSVVPLRDAEGRSRGCVATFHDVTTQKAIEEEIRLTLEGAPEAMLRVDGDGRIDLVNTQAEHLFGYARDHLLGQRMDELLRDHRIDFRALIAQDKNESLPRGRELTAVRKSGIEFPIEISLSPLRTRNGQWRLIASIIDISERKRAEAHQREFERKLQETQKLESLGILAGGIAHDFNNLLTGVLGNASLLDEVLVDQPEAKPLLRDIELAASRAGDLCRQMLAYAGKGRFVVKPVDLNEVIEETLHLVTLSLGKNCTHALQLATELPRTLADATQLRQIVMNLVINASEAMGTLGGTVTLRTSAVSLDALALARLRRAEEAAPGLFVLLEVSDTGSGMSPATQAKMFDPFFTTKFTGRGLGLAAVLGIIRSHQGALDVQSEEGRGTLFRVYLKAHDEARGPDVPPPDQTREPWRSTGHILVIDDEEAVRNVAARALRNYGFTVDLADDGESGIALFARQPKAYSAVLLDLTLPGMRGDVIHEELQRLRPNIPVVLMSGFSEEDALSHFHAQRTPLFVPKPLQISLLMHAIRESMASSAG